VADHDDVAIRVVLADDAADMRMLLRSTLQLDGRFEVVGEAADGRAVIELTGATQPDAVVLDLSMPALPGLQAIRRLRDRAPAAQVVVVSGQPQRDVADEAIAMGAAAYVEKGAVVSDLVEVLVDVCDEPAAPGTERDLDEILSFLAHELQNPVAVIQGLAATLRASKDVMDEDVVQAAVEAIERNARNLGQLVASLSEARALKTGRLIASRVPIPFASFVSETLHDLTVLTDAHAVVADIAADDVVVELDPVLVRQVITNLLSNATKFAPLGSPIRVEVTATPTAVELAVVDRGPGIPREREGELFEMFSRLNSGTKGMGLGLFISRGIALAHGGDLVHERPADGTGARFRLTLPR
jgi:signal transduction histidine kinase